MNDNAIRAITIGVGVIIAIATISLVLTYYNTAKEGMSQVGRGNNLYENYNKYVRDVLIKSDARGTDIINLLNYVENDPSITLNIYKVNNDIISKSALREIVKPNERFIITVNDEAATNITIRAID